ncbi:Pentatricopeptide repeat-containing protein [Melia azedarach]|uniref:Pentatricopeptide repeat-containing protein n=1 Tax=Melia azedarach TaxID=155640 RepID=A0ACC1XGS0_MELAZ|nr:Pentatricopeptide repeat-containing protein [Melia azedarach]
MNFFVDLRYFFPPIINLVILLLTSPHGVVSLLSSSSTYLNDYPLLKLASLAFVIFLSLLFILTSVRLHLTARPITLRSGYFSCPLAFSLLASIFLQPNLFWVAYFILIITSPWRGFFWDLQKRFWKSFVLALKAIPTLVITCTQRQNNPEPEAAQSTSGLVAVDFAVYIEGN